MPPLPPFVRSGEDDSCFYALAYCRGAYGAKEPRKEPVSLVLYFCTSPEYTRYSLHVVDSDGYGYAYFRGSDDLDTADYTLMTAWDDHGVPPAIWRLFPLSGIAEGDWRAGSDDRAAYFEARGDLCRIVYPFRIRYHMEVPPLFHRDPDFVPPSIMDNEGSEESREIFRTVMDAARRRSAEGGDSP